MKNKLAIILGLIFAASHAHPQIQTLYSSGALYTCNNGTWGLASGGGGGVSQIIAGTNVTVSPAGGTGAVTVDLPANVAVSGTLAAGTSILHADGSVSFGSTCYAVDPGLAGICYGQGAHLFGPIANYAGMSGGSYADASVWHATQTSSGVVASTLGAVQFYSDSGLTIGNIYT